MPTFIMFDIESTGLQTHTDRIVSIAFKDTKTNEEFYEEVWPEVPSSSFAEKVHGLNMAHLSKKPRWSEVGPRVWNWLLERQKRSADTRLILVGHNARRFDAKMLGYELRRLVNLPRAVGPIFVADTMIIARDLYPQTVLASKKQVSIYEHLFRTQPTQQHSAIGDVRALLRIARAPDFRKQLKTPEFALAFQLGRDEECWPRNILFI